MSRSTAITIACFIAFAGVAAVQSESPDGAPLDATEGPLRVITVGEKRPARWVRTVVRIRMRQLPQ
jgi:hypothetical protein